MTPSFSCPLPVQIGGGRRSGSLPDDPQDCSTSEAFSPRTVLTENICRSVQHKLEHFTTTMPFLTTSTISLSCLASAAPQADSWWLGHVEPDDVVIADIAGQALDIVLHGPESAHKNDIVKTFTHTSIFFLSLSLSLFWSLSVVTFLHTSRVGFFYFSFFNLGSFSCWLYFSLGSFSYTSHDGFIF